MTDFRCKAAVAALVLALPVAAPAQQLPDFDHKNWTISEDLERYRIGLYRQHQECSSVAMERYLSVAEAGDCARTFLELKLSFLYGVTLESYDRMAPFSRAYANSKGYDAYRAWLHRHVAMGLAPNESILIE